MKRSSTLFLASVLLVFTLTACGRKQPVTNPAQDNVPTTEDSIGNGTTGNGTTGNNALDGTTNYPENGTNGSLAGDVGNAVTNGIDDVEDAVTGENLPGENRTTNRTGTTTGGVTYEQMLRNARVHDTDGYLRDHENAVTPGSIY
ncbi:hypothetical protein [Oscillibacter sp.]|uniref:LptM family lipoprotein n=1 Tax=Oscillibacter sp. TaxID=1945593 RepID=UPI00262D06E3|nr:hypothetical protein [Oscillibacter sp.]MDD3347693.1 hypothetical protein [Oscillibacter sp.]